MKRTPHRCLRSSYDPEADALHIDFKKPSHATDSGLTDDVIVRYEGEEVVGLTVPTPADGEMNPSSRNPKPAFGNRADRWFLTQIKEIVDFEEELATSHS